MPNHGGNGQGVMRRKCNQLLKLAIRFLFQAEILNAKGADVTTEDQKLYISI